MIKHIAKIYRRRLSQFAVLALSLPFVLAQANAQLASPITPESTNTVIAGKIVWADLITTDVDAALAFYAGVFDWEVRHSSNSSYAELAHNGKVIAAVAKFDDDDVDPGDARWLVSISVSDVDEAARKIESNNGAVLEAPEDFPERGRFAVVNDAQGAVLMVLRASGGDPNDADNATGAFGWAELWTDDVAGAVDFYEQSFGYRALRIPGENDSGTVILTVEDVPRATIVEIPGDDVEPNWVPYILVSNAHDTLQRIADAGGAVLLTSDDVDGNQGLFAAIVADPTGGVFAIQEVEDEQ